MQSSRWRIIWNALTWSSAPQQGVLWGAGVLLLLPMLFLALMQIPLPVSYHHKIIICLAIVVILGIVNLIPWFSSLFNVLLEVCGTGRKRILWALSGIFVFQPVGIWMLAWLAGRQRKWIPCVILAVCPLLLMAPLGMTPYFPADTANLLPGFIRSSVLIVGLTLFCGLKSRRIWYALAPFFCAWVAMAAVITGNMRIARDTEHHRAHITALAGRPTTQEAFRDRLQDGFPPYGEPFQTVGLQTQEQYDELNRLMNKFREQSLMERHAAIAEYSQRNDAFVQAVHALASLPPQHVAHTLNADGFDAVSIRYDELSAFSAAAKLLSLEMLANADDSEAVAKCNRGICVMRDCALADEKMISVMYAIAMEAIRLDVLAQSLQHRECPIAEWITLLGEEPDWNRRLARSLQNEFCEFENIIMQLCAEARKNTKTSLLSSGNSFSALFIQQLFFQNDLNFASQYFDDEIAFCIDASSLGMEPQVKADFYNKRRDAMEEWFTRASGLVAGMFMPECDRAIYKCDTIRAHRQLASIAWNVVNCHHQTGLLPASLDELPDTTPRAISGLPVIYECGDIVEESTPWTEGYSYNGFRLRLDAPSETFLSTTIHVPMQR